MDAFKEASLEDLVNQARRRRQDIEDADDQDDEDDAEQAFVVHEIGDGMLDTGCGAGVIGLETLQDHQTKMKEAGLKVKWLTNAPLRTFRYGGGAEQKAIGVADIECRHDGSRFILRQSVVPGKTPFLISNPAMKQLGAKVDMEADKIDMTKIGVQLSYPRGRKINHYTMSLCDKPDGKDVVNKDPYIGVAEEVGISFGLGVQGDSPYAAIAESILEDPLVKTALSFFH